AGVAFGVDRDEQGSDPDRITGCPTQLHDHAIHRRLEFDRRLVGHYGCNGLIFLYAVPDGDQPFHELRFGDPLADIGKLELETSHLSSPSRAAGPLRCGSVPESKTIRGNADKAYRSRSPARSGLRDDRSTVPAPAPTILHRSRWCG